MADLTVSGLDVTLAAVALHRATLQAQGLPTTSITAHAELDMRGSPVSAATARFLVAWDLGLEQLEESGRELTTWLYDAADRFAQTDRALAREQAPPAPQR